MKAKLFQALLLLLVLSACTKNEPKMINQEVHTMQLSTMQLSSPAFENNGLIPKEYTCQGEDMSPELHITNVPESTKSLALIMEDPDAPMGTFVHWLVWNIPPTEKVIEKNAKIEWPQGRNDFGKIGYGGPCPPSGTHRYYFKLYALDTVLNLKEGANKKDLVEAMSGHIIAETTLMGKFSKS